MPNFKQILIGSGLLVATGASAYFLLGNTSTENIVGDYEAFLDKLNSSKIEQNISASCNNKEKFADNMQNLEKELADLRAKREQREKDLQNPAPINDGSQPLELSDWNSTDLTQKRPGSEPLELSDGDYSKPGSKPLELSDGDYTPVPGSQPLELSDGDYSNSDPISKQLDILEEKITQKINSLRFKCDEQITEKTEKEIISNSCDLACKKYSDCTGYTEGSTEEDQKDAYDSCMIECQNWSDTTKICINKKAIKTPMDCAHLSACALTEY